MTMPTDEDDGGPNWFDRFANHASRVVSHAIFFSLCVLLVVIWFPTLFFMPLDMSQLIINTVTTIITFLLVALLENTSKRGSDSQQAKLNAIANALAVMMEDMECDEEANELRTAVGLEEREGT